VGAASAREPSPEGLGGGLVKTARSAIIAQESNANPKAVIKPDGIDQLLAKGHRRVKAARKKIKANN
jgi:hypothetical protein